jgi:hypothetical protein
MRRLLLTGVALAALLVGGAAPVLANHETGCAKALAATATTPGAQYVAAACARTHPGPQNP